MPAQAASQGTGSVTIRIGDQDYEKPWVPSCGACTSMWLGQIDNLLAAGWSASSIVSHLRSRRPQPPRAPVITAHVPHLAQPHYEQRVQAERSRGVELDDGVPVPDLGNVAEIALQKVMSGMASGAIVPPLRDVVSAMRLRQQIAADSAGLASQEAMQAALMEIFEIARRHLSGPAWEAFTRDIYNSDALVLLMEPRRAITSKEAV